MGECTSLNVCNFWILLQVFLILSHSPLISSAVSVILNGDSALAEPLPGEATPDVSPYHLSSS